MEKEVIKVYYTMYIYLQKNETIAACEFSFPFEYFFMGGLPLKARPPGSFFSNKC